MSKNTTNIDEKVKQKITDEEVKNHLLNMLLIIWSISYLAFVICLLVALFVKEDKYVVCTIILGCTLVIITATICLTIIICKCLSTRDKNDNPYQEALTNMLTSTNKKGNSGNSGSPSTPITPVNPTSPETPTNPTTPTK